MNLERRCSPTSDDKERQLRKERLAFGGSSRRRKRFKKSLETHLRAAFAYLGMVQHHLNLAKAFSAQGIARGNAVELLLSTNANGLQDSIQGARNLEKRGSFKRVSPELFVKIISFCDSPSLTMASSVSKQWRRKILSVEELFRSFTMRGHPVMISLGLELFQKRCKNTIHSVDLQVSDADSHKFFVTCKLEQSVHTLRSLKVEHQGELGPTLLRLAEKCKSLSVFSSTRLGDASAVKTPPLNAESVPVEPSWTDHQQFETFIWNCGESNLECNDVLLVLLQKAKVVLINSLGFSQDTLIELLSTNLSLVDLRIPCMSKGQISRIPRLDLPNLRSLSLPRIPLFKGKQSSFFFTQLDPRSLQDLTAGLLENPYSIGCSYSLLSLTVGLDGIAPGLESSEASASNFFSAINDFSFIQRLNLQLRGEGSSAFCKHFLALCTPYSKETIQVGWKDYMMFHYLESIKICGTDDVAGRCPITVDASTLISFVAARKAVHRRVSLANVLLSANGHFTASDEPVSSPPNVLFEGEEDEDKLQASSMIEEIDIKDTDAQAFGLVFCRLSREWKWLSSNLLRFGHP